MPAPTFPTTPRPEELARPVVQAYERAVDELLINIARNFNVNDADLGTQAWRFRQLAKLGQLTRENIKIIAKATGQNEALITEALTRAAIIALDDVEPSLREAARLGLLSPPAESGGLAYATPRMQGVLDDFNRQAVDKLNLVNTTMLQSSLDAYTQGISNIVMNAERMAFAQGELNLATAKTLLGTEARHTAVRTAIKRMTDAGITGFYDRAGRKWSAEAYVNMDVGTTMHNAYIQAAATRNEDYGNDLVYAGIKRVSRPLCYPWQGKVLSMNNRSGVVLDLNDNPLQVYPISQTTYGEPAGLWGINCGHSYNVFIAGLSIIRGEVPDKDENDALYALTQEQRRLEREVRYAKRDAAIADATGDKEAFDAAALRVKQKQANLNAFLKENDLNASVYRTQVVGYNRSVSAKATAATRAST